MKSKYEIEQEIIKLQKQLEKMNKEETRKKQLEFASDKQLEQLLNLLNKKIKEYNIPYYSFFIDPDNHLARMNLKTLHPTVDLITPKIKDKGSLSYAKDNVLKFILMYELHNQLKDLLKENDLISLDFDIVDYTYYFIYKSNLYELTFKLDPIEILNSNDPIKLFESTKLKIDYLQGMKYVSGKQFTINQPDYDILISTPVRGTKLKYKVTRKSFELKDVAEKIKDIDTVLESIPDHETY